MSVKAHRSKGALIVAALACMATVGTPSASGHDASFARRFASAGASSGAMFRWWWPGADVAEPELVAEVDAIADAGYKGVEIADVMLSVDYPVDPDRFGYGTARWNHAVEAVLRRASERGLKVDLTLGAHWPAAVPGLDVNGPASAKELAYGLQLVRSGSAFNGPVPPPAPRTYADRTSENGVIETVTKTAEPSFVALSAVRCVHDDCTAKPLAVNLASRVDLTGRVAGGALSWTPPDRHTWVLVGSWARGTAQRNDAPFANTAYLVTDPESRVVDHFGRAGARAFLDYFGRLLAPETRRLLRAVGGSVFEDSLELRHSQVWTRDFLDQFQTRRGYSLVPYLPVLASDQDPNPFASSIPALGFTSADAAVVSRVMRDVDQTISDLYLANHVAPIKGWFNALGVSYRAQPYGEPIDLAQASASLDVTECEALGCPNDDDWRMMAAASEMAGHSVVSDELLPGGFGTVYGNTQQDIARQVDSEYAAGATQMVFHGFDYATWPESADGTIGDDSRRWPGFHSFALGIPEAFGPRQPTWTMTSDMAAYYARSQLVLQAGAARTDVAVYNQSLGHVSGGFGDPALIDAGYTYGYVTPGSLRLPAARVERGVLAPGGPAFRALILDGQGSMPLGAAQRLLALARKGLPVVVAGRSPAAIPGYAATAADAAADDAALRDVIAELQEQPTVRRVATDADVPAALASLGVAPAATSTAPAVRILHRLAGDTDVYYLYNNSAAAVTGTVTLSGDGRPFTLDPWSGSIAPVARYTRARGRIGMPLSLLAGEAKLLAIAPAGRGGVHVLETTADAARWNHGELVLRDRSAGTYTARLSTGRTVTRAIRPLPRPLALTTWDLALDEYRPGGPGEPSSATRHVPWRLHDIALSPWSAFPEISDAVGVGTYTANVALGAGWKRAVLDLGAVGGSFRVAVNGRPIRGVDQLDSTVDVGRHLRTGSNVIEVRVATTLLNRLRVFRPAEFGDRAKQDYGLIGPVRLVPYGEVAVHRRR